MLIDIGFDNTCVENIGKNSQVETAFSAAAHKQNLVLQPGVLAQQVESQAQIHGDALHDSANQFRLAMFEVQSNIAAAQIDAGVLRRAACQTWIKQQPIRT